MLGEKVRKYGFWTLDYLKGSSIRKHYNDVAGKINERKISTQELSNILNYAVNNVEYYNRYKNSEFFEFPVVNKSNIVDNFDSFRSSEFKDEKLHWVSTSGSTGVPFKAYQNVDKRNRTIADLLYIHEKNDWNLGDRYVFLRAWTSNYNSSKLKNFMQNSINSDAIAFGEESKENLRMRLKKDKKIKVILGYASAMEDFVSYLEEKGDKANLFNVKVIFTGSDNLSELTKQRLEKMFDCPVINRYSNEEQGPMAYTPAYADIFVLNTASYHFELLKLDKDEPANKGEIGRLIVTDLYNRAMPFIRYDTGDLAISNDDKDNIRTLSSLEGRISDILFDTDKNIISAAIVNNYMQGLSKIKKYQLIQEEWNKYVLKFICGVETCNEDEILNVCKKMLGEKAKIIISSTEEIPFEHTGKYKSTINLCK